MTEDLVGFVVGVTSDRRADEQVLMFERLGIDTVVGPTIRTVPVGDDGPLREATDSLVVRPPDLLVADTAVGIRSWFGMAATWGLEDRLLAAVQQTRIVARGPKAAAAVGVVGLDVWWRPEEEQLSAVGEGLIGGRAGPISGRRVALQLNGDHDRRLANLLAGAGADVVEVPVYRWALPDDPAPALRLVERCIDGSLDAITFTAAPAVRNLLHLADGSGLADALVAALNGPVLPVCVGPVCAAALRNAGVQRPLEPRRWRLGSMVREAVLGLRERRVPLSWEGHSIVVQGSAAVVDGNITLLTDRERAVLGALSRRPGSTVSRHALLAGIWGDAAVDVHALEAVVGRLRAKLGDAGGMVQTVIRRGYRLDTTPPAGQVAVAPVNV